jgi:hypothetical protein
MDTHMDTKKVQGREMEAATGFEPVNNGFADRCLTPWLCRPKKTGAGNGIRTRDFNLGKVALYR